jgi:hypothetical protein
MNMVVVVFILTLLLGIYIMAIAPIKNDSEYREKYSHSSSFWIFIIIVAILFAFISTGNCSSSK